MGDQCLTRLLSFTPIWPSLANDNYPRPLKAPDCFFEAFVAFLSKKMGDFFRSPLNCLVVGYARKVHASPQVSAPHACDFLL